MPFYQAIHCVLQSVSRAGVSYWCNLSFCCHCYEPYDMIQCSLSYLREQMPWLLGSQAIRTSPIDCILQSLGGW